MFGKEKIFIGLAVFIAIISVIILIFPQIWITVFSKVNFSETKTPELYQKPLIKESGRFSCETEKCLKFSYFGIDFQTNDWQMDKRQIGNNFFRIVFANEKSLIITDNSGMPTFLETLNSGNFSQKQIEKIRDFYGSESLESNYYFFKNILSASPKDISLSLPKKEAIAKISLLFLKKAFLSVYKPTRGRFYEFEANGFKGFQYGDPENDSRITVDFFIDGGKGWTFIFSGFNGEEINLVLESLKIIN